MRVRVNAIKGKIHSLFACYSLSNALKNRGWWSFYSMSIPKPEMAATVAMKATGRMPNSMLGTAVMEPDEPLEEPLLSEPEPEPEPPVSLEAAPAPVTLG